LAGAQFALPAAVEQLRSSAAEESAELLVLASSDPANVWNLPRASLADEPSDAFARPRGARALIVSRNGRVIMTADHAARTVMVRDGVDPEVIASAARALVAYVAARRPRDVVVERINDEAAAVSALAPAFTAAGLRLTTAGLRYYASFARPT
jgi:hypothetical protein